MAYNNSDVAKALANPGASGPGGIYNQIRASMGSSSSSAPSAPAPSSGGGGGASPTPSAPSSQYGAGQGYWSTVNGPRTVPQMAQELAKVGYNGPTDPGSILSAYGRTTGSQVTADNTNNLPGGGGPTPQALAQQPQMPGVYVPPGDLKSAYDAANQAAYNAYLNARLALDTDQEAYQKAAQAATTAMNEAALTGVFNGAPTQAAQNQQFQQGVTTAGLTGTYQGAPTLAAQKQAADIANQQQGTALSYLGLISKLSGPQDYSQYLRTLGSTPGGLRDLVGAAAGQYVPATGATTGVNPQAASLGGLVNAASTGTSGGTNYADYMNTIGSLPAPNQISPNAWNAFTTSQKQMLLGAYGSQGYDLNDVQDLYKQSLPNYAGPSGAGTVRLA